MLETAGGMRGLVLEVEVDAGKAGEAHMQQVRICRACGFALQGGDGGATPLACVPALIVEVGRRPVHADHAR